MSAIAKMGNNLLASSGAACHDGNLRIWSLWDIMKKFDAGALCYLVTRISAMECGCLNARLMGFGGQAPTDEMLRDSLDLLQQCVYFCDKSVLSECAEAAKHAHSRLTGPLVDNSVLATNLNQVKGSLVGVVDKIYFVNVSGDRVQYLDQEHLFGEKVSDSFLSAVRDIKEAGNCLATERTTAAVFHLMRAAEIALRQLAKDRGVTYPHSSVDEQQCGALITSLDKKLADLRGADKKLWPSETIKNEQIRFYHLATIELRSFNEAWRKHACHAGGDSFYDRHQALSVFEHVRTFMQILATRISENATTKEYWDAL